MHKRREILESVRNKLIAIKEFHWIRNTRGTEFPFIGNQYPGVSFYAESEETDTLTIHSPQRPQQRKFNLTVRVWVMQNGSDIEYAEQQMDIQANRVEQALDGDMDDINDLSLIQTDFEAAEDEPKLHVVTLTYRIDYATQEN